MQKIWDDTNFNALQQGTRSNKALYFVSNKIPKLETITINEIKASKMGKYFTFIGILCYTEKKGGMQIWLNAKNTLISYGHGKMSN